MTPNQQLFLSTALRLNLLSKQQLVEIGSIVKNAESSGQQFSLENILLTKAS